MNVSTLASLLALDDLAQHLDTVERSLEDALDVDNTYISDPALRVTRGGGKRLRPALAIAAAAVAGGRFDERVVAAATALELVHAGSLVHDDIMDEAETRRGVPTISAVEGLNHAILVGDFLLARAGELAASVSREAAGCLARAIAELCDGQSRETVSTYDNGRTVDEYERSIAGKTAALIRASCEMGALCVEGAAGIEALRSFGTAFGMAFQIVDDILDLASTAEALGKPVGNDIKEGVYTLPVLFLLESPEGDAYRPLLRRGITADELARVIAAQHETGAIERAVERVREYNAQAAAALAELAPSPTLAGLQALPDEYLAWAIREKAPALAAG